MKVTGVQVQNFARNLPPDIKAAMIYGPDAGLVDERAAQIAVQITGANPDPFSLAEIGLEKLKEDPGSILEEISSISFFGGRKLIKIRNLTDGGAAPVAAALESLRNDAGNSFLLITAGELGPRSSLRLLFEKEKGVVALPCYQDDAGALTGIVRAKLKDAGFEFENNVPEIIAANMVGDRMILNSELEKLFIYKGDNNLITISDIETLLIDSAEISVDELCLSVADRDMKKLYQLYHKSVSGGVEPIRIIRQLLGYFSRINVVYGKIKARVGEQEAISALKPPIFFKNLPHFKRHLAFWAKSSSGADSAHESKLDRVFSILLRAELECKRSGNAELLCSESLMQICQIK